MPTRVAASAPHEETGGGAVPDLQLLPPAASPTQTPAPALEALCFVGSAC